MKKILLTGGGTAGHVTPNIALLPELKAMGLDIIYVGGKTGIERELIEACGISYLGVSSGKLRRYFSLENAKDAFRVVKGLGEAYSAVRKEKPDVIFSKGGFVAVPVVAAGFLCGVPVVIHESDMSPGLANKLSMPFARAVCVAFPETLTHIKNGKGVLTGTPIRRELFSGVKEKGLSICGFDGVKPIVLVVGGSSGAARINACLWEALPALCETFDVAHICGKSNADKAPSLKGYKSFGYVTDALPHLLGAADVVVSRAGANAICELLALKKPNLLIPISKDASRGDQILNAASFEKRGFSAVLSEEEMNAHSLPEAVKNVYADRDAFIAAMDKNASADGVGEIVKVISKFLK